MTLERELRKQKLRREPGRSPGRSEQNPHPPEAVTPLNRQSSKFSNKFSRRTASQADAEPIKPSQAPIPLHARKSDRTGPQPQSESVQALQPKATPTWLKLLLVFQRSTSVLTFGMIALLLAVYGWTVYTQQRWGQSYSRLETLQKQERQLMAASEVIKNQMAKQAEAPGVGLVLPEPGNTIFLTPAPERPAVEPEVNLPPPQPIPARPLGY